MAKNKGNAIDVGMPDDWQAKQDVQTLMDAHKIKSDKKRHAAAKAHAKKQLQAMRNVAIQGATEQDDGDDDDQPID